MYRYLRNTHLFLGLFSCLFLLMYGVSAVQMAHSRWFGLKPRTSEVSFSLAPGETNARAVARELMERHDLRGELGQVRSSPAGLNFRITRPGTIYEVDYAAATGRTAAKVNVASFMGMLNRIHHVHGVRHEYGLLNVWGYMVAVVSVMLLVIGATGVYLWFRIHKERTIGGVIFGAGLLFSLTLLVLVRTAG